MFSETKGAKLIKKYKIMDELIQIHAMFEKVNKRIADIRIKMITRLGEEIDETEKDPDKAAIHKAKADAIREMYDFIFTQKLY